MKYEKYIVKLSILINSGVKEHQYFNYNIKNNKIKEYKFDCEKECYMIRDNEVNKIFEISSIIKDDILDTHDVLFRLRKSKKKEDKFEIINPLKYNMKKTKNNIDNLDENAWYVIKSNEEKDIKNNNEKYILNKHDIIKLGKTKFEIIDIKDNTINKDEKDLKYNISRINREFGPLFDINLKENQYKVENQDSENSESKIDNTKYMNSSNIIDKKESFIKCSKCEKPSATDDPLLNLCQCNKIIHYKCLKNILKNNIDIPNEKEKKKENIIEYKCKNFLCNECLTSYPIQFKILDKLYSLIDIGEQNTSNYLILEILNDFNEGDNIIRKLYLIKLENNQKISIGRYDENHISIKDSFVSGKHAEILNENGNIIIKDNNSKFGTLVLIKGNVRVLDKKINLQVGNSYITSNLEKKNNI